MKKLFEKENVVIWESENDNRFVRINFGRIAVDVSHKELSLLAEGLRQIEPAKKWIYKRTNISSLHSYHCPTCKVVFTEMNNFCPNCGTKLDDIEQNEIEPDTEPCNLIDDSNKDIYGDESW